MKAFFVFLWRLLLILLVVGVVLSVFFLLEWPMELAYWVLGIGFGVFFAFIFGRRLYVRYRARAQVKRVIRQGQVSSVATGQDVSMSASALNRALNKRWRQTMRALKRSQLKLRGDPLYVLPWYMIIGRPTTGKSTSLRSAQLLKPGIENISLHEDGSTLNLEWWLYEEAILIDTAGRYAVPEQQDRDRKEWDKLLSLLANHKQKEPLNGLVVAVSAERLLNCDEETILEEGRQVRTSINNLMDRLEIRVPVYLLVTKCDHIPGFSQWVSYLPDESLLQPMGFLNTQDTVDFNSVLDRGLDSVLDRMKELRLLMMERTDNPDDSLLSLPTEMEKIRENLHAFINTALVGNIYQEAPKFRGLYFGSSIQEVQGKATQRGVFLHEFFTRVLPSDRGLYESLPSIDRIRRAARRYALGIGGAVTLIAFTLLTLAYETNKATLENIRSSFAEVELSTSASPAERLLSAAELLDFALAMDQYQRSEWIPWRLPFGGGTEINELKVRFVLYFRNNVLLPVDNELIDIIDDLENEETSVVAGGLIRRINALQARLENDDPSLVPAVSNNFYGLLQDGISVEQSSIFHELYLTYLDWNSITGQLNEERLTLQSALLHLVNRNRGDYTWIVDWTNAQGYPSVRLEDFWGGSRRLTNPPQIDPAFTLAGYEFVNNFIQEFAEATQGDAALGDIEADFNQFYQREYRLAWEAFAERFGEGVQRYRDRREWLRALERMSGNDNPYFAFMERMHDELEVFGEIEYASSLYFEYFKELQEYTVEDAAGGAGPGASRAIKKVLGRAGKAGKLAQRAIRMQRRAGAGAEDDVNPLDTLLDRGVTAVDDYKAALSQVAFNAELRSQSLAALNEFFLQPDQLEAGSGPMADAWQAVIDLQEIFGRPDSNSALFWRLYTGPLDVAYDFMMQEGSCELQTRWENNVLASLEGVEPNRLGSLIVGDQGVLWQFLNDDAQAFVQRQLNRGYVPSEVRNRRMTLNPDFYQVLNEARTGGIVVGNEFDVTMRTLPSGTNAGAGVSPYATFLNLHCSDGVQTLANYNYPSQHTFRWSLETCGDTSLTIEIGQMRLTRDYPGVKGFARFLNDFRDGRYIFSASDFPSAEAQLRQQNVSQIDVNYQISGQRPVIQSLTTVPLSLPPVIASCWPAPQVEPQPTVQEAPTANLNLNSN
ncbi:MAG: hypothetical protein LAT65_07245 [Saccharospirillum sp.]|nr:hypothetical protein [Saccharospirillum sp.]